MVPVTWLLRLVVHGKHAAVEFVIVAEEFLLLPFGVETLAKEPGVLVLVQPPVELPSCVCPQLIEACILYLVVQRKEPLPLSLVHLYEFALYQITVLPVEFHVEHSTHIRCAGCIRASGVGREPDGVTQLVACVVHVYIHLFLRNGPSKGSLACSQLIVRREGRQGDVGFHLRHIQVRLQFLLLLLCDVAYLLLPLGQFHHL